MFILGSTRVVKMAAVLQECAQEAKPGAGKFAELGIVRIKIYSANNSNVFFERNLFG